MNAECMNPIIYIDELDKISSTEQDVKLLILTHQILHKMTNFLINILLNSI